jgi:RNase H-fold protein (predicted Holliday junction resolvase)
MVRGEGAVRIVVGHPLYRDGSLSPQANSTKEFARLIADRAVELGMIPPTGVPFVYLWDERLTSQAAKINIKTKSFLHSSDDIDSQAACLVLEDFYVHKAYKAEVVWPSEGVVPLAQKRRAAAAGAAGAEGGGGEEEGENEDGTSSSSSTTAAVTATTTRAGMSYSDYRKAELERYGRSSSAPAPSGSDEEGAAKKKKKKKKKK